MNGKEKGFSLLELLIGVTILAVGILALIGMQVAAINGNSSANQMTVATTLAQDKIEQLRRLDLTDADLADSDTGNNGDAQLISTDSIEHADTANVNTLLDEQGMTTGTRVKRYYRCWNVADDTPTEGVKTIVVFVLWGALENGLPRHRVMVQTIIGG